MTAPRRVGAADDDRGPPGSAAEPVPAAAPQQPANRMTVLGAPAIVLDATWNRIRAGRRAPR